MNYTALLLLVTLVFSVNAMEIGEKSLPPSLPLLTLYTSLADSWGEAQVWVLGLTPAGRTREEKRNELEENREAVVTLLEKNRQKLLDYSLLELCSGGLVDLAETTKERTDLAEMLIRQGASLSAYDMLGETPLHGAAQRYNLRLINVLLLHKANTKSRTILGMTPLHVTVRANRLPSDTIETLLSHDPTLINEVDNFGDSALHFAAQVSPDKSILTLLIDKGASINLQNNDGATPVDILKKSGKEEFATFMTEYAAQTLHTEHQES